MMGAMRPQETVLNNVTQLESSRARSQTQGRLTTKLYHSLFSHTALEALAGEPMTDI